MKTKKLNKILSVCFVAVLITCAAIGSMMALAAESDNLANNDGKVRLIMQQRNESGDFIEYQKNKVLYPIVGGLKIDSTTLMPQNENFVDCIVSAKNDSGESVALRILVAVPEALDEGGLHILSSAEVSDSEAACWETPECVGNITYEGVECNVYSYQYKTNLDVGSATKPAILGSYLDSRANNIDGFESGVKIPIAVQAVGEGGDLSSMDCNPWSRLAINSRAVTSEISADFGEL